MSMPRWRVEAGAMRYTALLPRFCYRGSSMCVPALASAINASVSCKILPLRRV